MACITNNRTRRSFERDKQLRRFDSVDAKTKKKHKNCCDSSKSKMVGVKYDFNTVTVLAEIYRYKKTENNPRVHEADDEI